MNMEKAIDRPTARINEDWRRTWDGGKYKTAEASLSLRALLDLNAYYSVTEGAWQEYVRDTINKLGKTNREATILEIGCGAGAFLHVLEPMFDNLWGVDFSQRQIELCRQALPSGNFTVCEARDIDFQENFFDLVLSNGVFQYFPDFDYAKVVLSKMLAILKANGVGVVLDVNDIEHKDAYIALKTKTRGEEFLQLPPQIHYPQEMFIEFAETNGLAYRIEQLSIQNYSNTSFRFNFLFWKEN